MSKIYQVTIDERKHIPFINKLGPITFPIPLKELEYNTLKEMGIKMTVIRVLDNTPKATSSFQEILSPEEAALLENDVAPAVVVEQEETADLSGITLESNDGVVDEVVNTLPEETKIQEEETTDVEVEVVVLSDEEIDELEVSDLRDYILQFEGALSAKELNVAKTAQQKKLLELAKSISKKARQ